MATLSSLSLRSFIKRKQATQSNSFSYKYVATSKANICREKGSNGSTNTFFLENALKKTTEYFLKFLFLFESTILPINNGK